MLARLSMALITLLLACSFAGAEMYQWVGEDGAVTFKDSPPPASKKRKKVKAYSENDFASAPISQPASPSQATSPKSNGYLATSAPASSRRFEGVVEIFLTDWCGYCKKAKRYMDDRGIRYQAYDIEKDSAAQRRYQELGGNGVPLILIGSQRMSGFSAEALEQYLNRQ